MANGATTAQPLDARRPPAPASLPALGRRAASGMAWMMVQTVSSKAATFISQLVLARLLDPKVFGQVGLTFTVATLVNMLQQSGQRELLIQRQARLRRWLLPATWISLA